MKLVKRMILPSVLVAAAMALPTTANAKPVNAAEPGTNDICITRASEADAYQLNTNCSAHSVIKRDKDGNIVSYRYQDKAPLNDTQVAPDRVVRVALTGTVAGLPCTGTELITPSGHYSSNLKCR